MQIKRSLLFIVIGATVTVFAASAFANETASGDRSSTPTSSRRDPCIEFSQHKNKLAGNNPQDKTTAVSVPKKKTARPAKQ